MKIGFVGMTHLGLCYLAACAHKKFAVKGFDLDREKINNLNRIIFIIKCDSTNDHYAL